MIPSAKRFSLTISDAMNSLQTRTIRHIVSGIDGQSPDADHRLRRLSQLNVNVRQSVVDYLTDRKVVVSAQAVDRLLSAGLKSFDLWRLCQNNRFSTTDVMTLLETMAKQRHCFQSLSLGGSEWIFCPRVVRGPLKKLFEGTLSQLVTLRMQQIATCDDLLATLKSCPRLKRLEIALPCLTDRDIDRMEDRLKQCPSVDNIRQLSLPSSFKQRALMKVLAIFAKTKTLKCVHFEQLMDLIEFSIESSAKNVSETAMKAKQTLSSLTSLTITQPMSCDAIDRLVSFCPQLKTLSIEVQKDNDLMAINRFHDIRNLELRNSPTAPVQWAQVVPLLEAIGGQLLALSLEHFEFVDLTVCAKRCPQLVRFSAQWFTLLGFIRPNTPSSQRDRHLKCPFANLSHLRLRPLTGRDIPADGCAFVLSHATRLSHIELYCCYDLSDSDVQALYTKNSLLDLRSLILRHGHKVTKDALNLLVSKASKLSFIDCGIPLTKEDSDDQP